MGAYYYVYAAVREPLLDIGYLLCSAQAADVIYGAGEVLEPVGESIVMLQRKDGGRYQHGHLLAVGDCLEGGPHRKFRLAEAHVAAHEPVHRAAVLHIALDGLARSLLVGGVLEYEGRFQLFLEVSVSAEGEALGSLSLRVKADEVLGNVLHLGLGARLERLPGLGAELVDARGLSFLGAIAGYLVEGVHRDENDVSILVGQFHYFFVAALVVLHPHQASEYTYAVVDVNHVVAYVYGVEVVDCQLLVLLDGTAHLHALETVEYLVVGIAADLVFVVYEAIVNILSRYEFRQQAAVLEKDGAQSFQLGLLFAVDKYFVSILKAGAYVRRQEFEVLVE